MKTSIAFDLIKYKSFVVSAPIAVSDALKPGLGKKIDGLLKLALPLNKFLAKA